MHRWGATDAEAAAQFPGDEFLPSATDVSTRAITVDASVSDLWPWLQQIDQQRAGSTATDGWKTSRVAICPKWKDSSPNGATASSAKRYG